jgi:hypothetical protein
MKMSYGNWNARSPEEVQRQSGKASDFNKIKERYENTKPLIGKRKSLDIRPSGDRNRTWERIVKDSENEYHLECQSWAYTDNRALLGEKIDLRSRAITYTQDEISQTITIHKQKWGFASPSVFFFYDYNLPEGVGLEKYRANPYVKVMKDDGRYDYYTLTKGDVVLFKVHGAKYWTPLQVHRETKHSLDRAKTKEIRKKLKEFVDYTKAILPLLEDPKYKYGAVFGNDWESLVNLKTGEDIPEAWLHTVTAFAGKCSNWNWNTRMHQINHKAVIPNIYKEAYKIDKPFKIEEVPLGQYSYDPYRSWV